MCDVRSNRLSHSLSVFLQDTNDNEAPDFRLRDSVPSHVSTEAASLPRPRLSPQSLLAASMASNPPSLVPLAGLAGYGRTSSVSPPAREAASPPSSSAGHSPRQPAAATGTGTGNGAQAPWNYEEQFKQVSLA